jgi:hypothetical protein
MNGFRQASLVKEMQITIGHKSEGMSPLQQLNSVAPDDLLDQAVKIAFGATDQ